MVVKNIFKIQKLSLIGMIQENSILLLQFLKQTIKGSKVENEMIKVQTNDEFTSFPDGLYISTFEDRSKITGNTVRLRTIFVQTKIYIKSILKPLFYFRYIRKYN
ncbi:hypothetical protein SAMN05421636_102324 [Pricia antarctica]|uniref:Uncharacterized protein n=1 Tax=Pricia antarctica TaxID=641691 RepID=A0A1G6YQ46_9FLAO|nr:hypothetical protein SAMN05421636_102324 [Pricia antarctica]